MPRFLYGWGELLICVELSVVVPTLNAREELGDCLDALSTHVPGAEVIVVNGPSADGTTGMIQKRDDVDVLVELADRTINVARNAGIERATGSTVALVNHTLAVSSEWADTVREGIERADVVTGPTRNQIDGTDTSQETRQIAGRDVSYFNAGNVAFRREPLDALDGFDEYLAVGGARDLAHRLAANDYEVLWEDRMAVTQELTTDGGEKEPDWGWKYRSLAYRLVKNYGLRPTVIRRLLSHASKDAFTEFRDVIRGDGRPSGWLGTGRDVIVNMCGGIKNGLGARRRDRTARRNPRGRTVRADRAVTVYDWR